ncbi:FHA domain-containing protein [Alkaliphilus crotonatoxidans]
MERSISQSIIKFDLAISIVSIIACAFIYSTVDHVAIKYITIAVLAAIALVYGLKVFNSDLGADPQKNLTDPITVIALLNEEDEIIREWELYGKTAVVIGRNTKEIQVDVDLSDVTYASLIDPQHAVMNFASGNWYIEDVHSQNGIGLQKESERTSSRLAKDKPCKVIKGDIVLIAKTKLLIR